MDNTDEEKKNEAGIKRRARYHANKDKMSAIRKSYRSANKDKLNLYQREWRKANNEKVIIQRRSYQQAYQQANPEKQAFYSIKRYATKLQATPNWFEDELVQQIYSAKYRLNEMWGTNFEVDHIYPLQGNTVCGLHCHANLQLLDKSLNASKSNNQLFDE